MTSSSRIAHLHRNHTENIGDLECAPYKYFPLGADADNVFDIKLWWKRNRGKPVMEDELWGFDHFVLGGGGLLEAPFFSAPMNRMYRMATAGKKVVIWGAGLNYFRLRDWTDIKPAPETEIPAEVLAGLRDFGRGDRWVPCSTCMSEHFDRHHATRHSVVAYLTRSTLARGPTKSYYKSYLEGVPIGVNTLPFGEAVDFLGSAETVLTNSFHGAYWATLLGRKVVAFPTSSKFYEMKHVVPLCDVADWERYAGLAVHYPDALGECREANRRFHEEVKSFFRDP